jgi:hypothetical protein
MLLGTGVAAMTSVQLQSRTANSRTQRRINTRGRASMLTFMTIGHRTAGHEATAQAVHDA